MAAIFARKLFAALLPSKLTFYVPKAFKSGPKTVQVDCSKLNRVRTKKGIALPISVKEATSSPEELEYERKWRHQPVDTPAEERLTDTNFIPKELQLSRTARIYKEAKNAMQSGSYRCRFWKVMFDVRERWENPLMGWTSTGDAISNVKLNFFTLTDAIHHCEKNGWDYYVDRPREVIRNKIRTYAANFAWNKRVRTTTK